MVAHAQLASGDGPSSACGPGARRRVRHGRRSTPLNTVARCRTGLWWIGLLGAVAAIATGLLAYTRVQHSELAHEEMMLHRNIALATVTILLITALWRWRRTYSRGAAVLGLVGAIGLAVVGYLGGDLVYRHALGIPTSMLEQIAHERVGHAHDESGAREGGAGTEHHHH